MPRIKNFRSSDTNRTIFIRCRQRFDMLDWLASVFVIVTPMIIVYQLLWN